MTTPADVPSQGRIKEQLQQHLEEIHHEIADLNRDPKNTKGFQERLHASDLKLQQDMGKIQDPNIKQKLEVLQGHIDTAYDHPSLESAGPVAKDVFALEKELKKKG